jgi:uncharacterized protein YqeY
MLQERINSDLVTAMKSKDTTTLNVLRVLKGEIQRAEQSSSGKIELSDADIVKLVKKSIDGINETGGNQVEIDVLEKYMPSQLSENDMEVITIKLILNNNYNSQKDMGKIMNYFNENYGGQYDGKVLSKMVKDILTNGDIYYIMASNDRLIEDIKKLIKFYEGIPQTTPQLDIYIKKLHQQLAELNNGENNK